MAMSQDICFRILFSHLLGTVRGFSIVTSLSSRLCSSHISFAAYLPPPIQREHRFISTIIADWDQLCIEKMLVYVEGCFELIGGPNKTGQIDERKFGRRKYYRGHSVKGQWVGIWRCLAPVL
jgi:hypothetical protein